MRSCFLGLFLIFVVACRGKEANTASSTSVPQLLPSEIAVLGVVPPGASGLVLTRDLVPCIGDPAMFEVICASQGDWATASHFGREGQGPEELKSATILGPGANGSLIVSDLGNRRLSWIDPETGSLIRTHPAPPLFRQSMPEENGTVVGSKMTPIMDFMSVPLTLQLVAVNSETGEVEWEREYVVPDEDRDEDERLLMSRGWLLPGGRVGAILSRGRIVHWSPEGEYLGVTVPPDYVPRTYTESEAVDRWEMLESAARRIGSPVRDSAETVREGMTMKRPPYRGEPKLGPSGTVWLLSTGDGDSSGSDFEVFHGLEYLGRVHVNEVVHEFAIQQTNLAILKDSGTLDEFGLEQRDLRFFEIVLPEDVR